MTTQARSHVNRHSATVVKKHVVIVEETVVRPHWGFREFELTADAAIVLGNRLLELGHGLNGTPVPSQICAACGCTDLDTIQLPSDGRTGITIRSPFHGGASCWTVGLLPDLTGIYFEQNHSGRRVAYRAPVEWNAWKWYKNLSHSDTGVTLYKV